MAKKQPSARGAEFLLGIMEIYLSDPLVKARNFWRTITEGLTFDGLHEKYPRGSEGFAYIDTVMVFWETIGSLMRYGLLNEDLAFDTFLDAPPWKKVERFIVSRREKENNPLEGENLEYAYRRSILWKNKKSEARQKGS